jgi:Protein of unknown function (DUF2846)
VKIRYQLLAVVGALSLLAGCASVPMADTTADASAKQFTPVADKAVVYIYRNETFGAAVKMDVKVDGKPIGQTASETYFRVVLAPGHHTVDSQDGTSTLDVDAQAGAVYYVWEEVKMGVWSANSKLHLQEAAKGQADVKDCKLIKAAI